jgi:ribosomal protein S18 acetylase RimI-like enzyme
MTMRENGCRKVSLTVTAANREAVDLYERMGFRTIRKFSAFVWEGFAAG